MSKLKKPIEINLRGIEALSSYMRTYHMAEEMKDKALEELSAVLQREHGVSLKDGEATVDTRYFQDCSTAFLCPPPSSPLSDLMEEANNDSGFFKSKGLH